MKNYIIGNNPQLQTNIRLSELACKCGCNTVKFNMETVNLLQRLRNHFNKPVIIVSAYRCPKHNAEVGGATESKHMDGIACDIQIAGVNPFDIAMYAVDLGFKGIGVYTHNGNMFIHVDTRTTPMYWRDKQGTHELVYSNKF